MRPICFASSALTGLRAQEDVHRDRVRDLAREADRGATEREQPALALPHAEDRALARDADVRALQHLGAARDRVPLDRGDERLREPVVAQQRLPVKVRGLGHPVADVLALRRRPHRLEVGARREVAARAGEDRAADLGRLVDVRVPVREPDEHVGAQRVAGLGAVHREDHDVALALDGAVLRGHGQGLGHAHSRSFGPIEIMVTAVGIRGRIGYPRRQVRTCSTSLSGGTPWRASPTSISRTPTPCRRGSARLLHPAAQRAAGVLARERLLPAGVLGLHEVPGRHRHRAGREDLLVGPRRRAPGRPGRGHRADDAQPGPAPAHPSAQPRRARLHAEGDQGDGAAHPRGGPPDRRPRRDARRRRRLRAEPRRRAAARRHRRAARHPVRGPAQGLRVVEPAHRRQRPRVRGARCRRADAGVDGAVRLRAEARRRPAGTSHGRHRDDARHCGARRREALGHRVQRLRAAAVRRGQRDDAQPDQRRDARA